jgi:hypothetical protein
MNNNDEIIAIILIISFVIMPIGWVIIAYPASPYFVVEGEPLREAAEASGLEIIHTEDILWPFPGATGGKIYILEDDDGNTLLLQTQSFESEAARNAAILTYSAQGAGKGRTVGKMLVVGREVIYISPDTSGILPKIAPSIKEAARTP